MLNVKHRAAAQAPTKLLKITPQRTVALKTLLGATEPLPIHHNHQAPTLKEVEAAVGQAQVVGAALPSAVDFATGHTRSANALC